jgi:hypothetical protein
MIGYGVGGLGKWQQPALSKFKESEIGETQPQPAVLL